MRSPELFYSLGANKLYPDSFTTFECELILASAEHLSRLQPRQVRDLRMCIYRRNSHHISRHEAVSSYHTLDIAWMTQYQSIFQLAYSEVYQHKLAELYCFEEVTLVTLVLTSFHHKLLEILFKVNCSHRYLLAEVSEGIFEGTIMIEIHCIDETWTKGKDHIIVQTLFPNIYVTDY